MLVHSNIITIFVNLQDAVLANQVQKIVKQLSPQSMSTGCTYHQLLWLFRNACMFMRAHHEITGILGYDIPFFDKSIKIGSTGSTYYQLLWLLKKFAHLGEDFRKLWYSDS